PPLPPPPTGAERAPTAVTSSPATTAAPTYPNAAAPTASAPQQPTPSPAPSTSPAPSVATSNNTPSPAPIASTPGAASSQAGYPRSQGYPAANQASTHAEAPQPAAPKRPISAHETLVLTCQRELETDPQPARRARLHAELARLSTTTQGALKHYDAALAALPDHLPSIRGARRTVLATGDVARANELFEQEIRLTEKPAHKARLWFDKGRMLEDLGRDLAAAASCFERAVELDATTPAYLHALAQCQRASDDWPHLANTHAMLANAVGNDAHHKSVIISERAKLLELRLTDIKQATELYEQALALDDKATGPMLALKRLHEQQQRWRDLITILEREAATTNDAAVRTLALYRAGRVHGEKLNNRDEGIGALARAMQVSPRDLLVLENLARLYEMAAQPQSVAHVLARRAEATTDARQRLGLLQRVAAIHERDLNNDEAAQPWYEAALQIDPTYTPALHALDSLYQRRQSWQALIVMHLAAAEALTDGRRRAASHARIAEVFERYVRRIDEAIRHYQHALALQPDHEGAFKALTRLYAQVGSYRELVELHERAVERTQQADVKISYLMKIGTLFEDALREPENAVHAY
ncbi:MAG TPA: hypothetical protein ENK23_00410, partial [Sorangium sp.]|nr:hypothetical protein [Sorangium sp.]